MRSILQFTAAAEAFLESIDATAGVNNLLLASVERMALGADVNTNVLTQGGTGFDNVTATTNCLDVVIVWMNFCLHFLALYRFRYRNLSLN